MNTKVLYYITQSGVINLNFDNRTVTVQPDWPTYAKIREAIKNKDWAAIPDLVDIKTAVQKQSDGKIQIVDEQTVTYNGAPLHNAMTERLLKLFSEGYEIDPFVKFMENVLLNPSETAVKELYLFLEKSGIPITEDGQFLAYRRVRSDYLSIHANPDGTRNRNMVGDVCEMPSNMIDEDRNNTCSRGLHACSLSYLPHYGSDSNGDKIMIVKIHPKDVRTIPADYNNAKMRVSKYTVVSEHKLGEKTSGFNAQVYSADGISSLKNKQQSDSLVAREVNDIIEYLANVDGIDDHESFAHYGLDTEDLAYLLDELEDEFNLPDQDLDYVSIHSPIRVVTCFYENVLLKAGRDIK